MLQPNAVQVILRSLLPPLCYGARDEFAHLPTLKGLEALVAAVANRASQMGAEADLVGRLREQVRGFDSADASRRREILVALSRELASVIELPMPLDGLAARAEGASATTLPLGSAAKRVRAPAPASAPAQIAGPPASPAVGSAGVSGPLAAEASGPAADHSGSRAPEPGAGGAAKTRRRPAGQRFAAGTATTVTEGAPSRDDGAIRGAPAPAATAKGGRRRRAAKPGELFAEKPKSRAKASKKVGKGARLVERELEEGPRASEGEVVYPAVSPASGPLATAIASVTPLRGKLAGTLKERGMSKVGELLFFFPRTYEDRRAPVPIARLRVGERGVSIGTVKLIGEAPVGRRRVFRVVLGDGTGTIAATWYHYQPWMRGRYKVGERYVFSGEVRSFGGIREVAHPEMEPADEVEGDVANFGRIVPVYPGFERGGQHAYRALAQRVVERYAQHVQDPLPPATLARADLPALPQAVAQVHFPQGVELASLEAHATGAQRRLAFDELFFIQLGVALRRKGVRLTPGIAFRVDDEQLARAIAKLPFSATGAQRRALSEIVGDMRRPEPMNRLLQGDVGSGKTAVAMTAAMLAADDGYQTALMAPTEILAEQHYRSLCRVLEPAGYRVSLLTAGLQRRRKDEVKEQLQAGGAQVVVGTHALLEEDVDFSRLGLVVIDEQHRFGVLQRAKLIQKGVRPDVLVMTATPIPRTLAMTLYGDLDVSVLDELPPGRTPVTTRVFSERNRDRVYELVARELAKGRQAFVVYPLVEESETLDLESATEGAQKLAARFPDARVGLVHGRMKSDEKDSVMAEFRGGNIRLLVSTTVIEVGVDVPNASVMVVESAERFGLSQLHQLRGRVGRGSEQSYCFLVGAAWRNEVAMQRLAIMERTTDGFVVAEEDLRIRGPGEFLGTRQSGMPGLVVADLARDQDLLVIARREALQLADEDPRLERLEHQSLRRALDERWEGKLGLARVS